MKNQIETKEENKQETEEEIKQNKPNTEDKKVKDTTEKNNGENTKEKDGAVEQVTKITPTVPIKIVANFGELEIFLS